jgi:uncharacterized membrane protein YhaH (DUF805 family)
MQLTDLLFSFQGRIRRLHWWLAHIGAFVAAGFVLSVVRMLFPGAPSASLWMPSFSPVYGLAATVVGAAHLWVAVALDIKRCHDRDKPGWWILIFYLIPFVGWVWGLIELGFLDGTQGSNKYGPSPKGVGGAPAHA